jgi:hypothetical protein
MFDQAHEDVPALRVLPGVTQEDRHTRVQIERRAHVLHAVAACTVEAIERASARTAPRARSSHM